MAEKPLKTLNFGGEDTYVLTPNWNDLTDKPFGEITEYVDTLEWDGNTDGLFSVLDTYYHVSDAVPTLTDLANGGFIVFGGVTHTFDESDITNGGTYLSVSGNYFLVISEENTVIGTIVYEKKGVYLKKTDDIRYVSKFVINESDVFPIVETKTLDPKYLPEDVDCDWNIMKNKPFGEEISEEIIYENGEYNYSLEEFEDLPVTVTLLDGTEGEYIVMHIYVNGEDGDYDYYALVDEDENELEKKNIKSIRYYDTVITPLDSKYLPEGVGGGGFTGVFSLSASQDDIDEELGEGTATLQGATYEEIYNALLNQEPIICVLWFGSIYGIAETIVRETNYITIIKGDITWTLRPDGNHSWVDDTAEA